VRRARQLLGNLPLFLNAGCSAGSSLAATPTNAVCDLSPPWRLSERYQVHGTGLGGPHLLGTDPSQTQPHLRPDGPSLPSSRSITALHGSRDFDGLDDVAPSSQPIHGQHHERHFPDRLHRPCTWLEGR
jgi:hypothetical protein